MIYSPDQKFYFSEMEFLNYRVIGAGENTVIFLHGFGASSRTWDDIIPYLDSPNTKFIFFDLIGAGFSSKSKSADYSMQANALVIGSFIRKHDIRDYALVGHSFGGGVSLLTTLAYVESTAYRPSALVLLDAAAYGTKLPFFVEYLRIPFISNIVLKLMPSKILSRLILQKLYYNSAKVTDEKVERYSFFMSENGNNSVLIETARQITLKDLSRNATQYKKITLPTLVLWGRQDTVLPLDDGENLSKDIPTAKLVIIENSGHNIQEEQPKVVARLINVFLGDVWGGPASRRGFVVPGSSAATNVSRG